MRKKIILCAMFFCILLFGANIETIMAQQVDGNDINYMLTADGVLTISGTGEITSLKEEQMEQKHGIDTSEVKKIVISNGITSIGEYACSDYPNVLEVKMADSVRTIGESAFEKNSKLKKVELSPNIDEISAFAFYECTSLKTLTGINCSKIGRYAFSGCVNLRDFTLPDKVTTIGERAFWACFSLTKFTFPKELVKIDKKALYNCPGLKSITNRSAKSWDLKIVNGARTWYCGKKKVTKVASGKTVKAVAKKYKVKYQLNGGKMKGKAKTSYRYGVGIKANQMPKPVRKGYRFVEWLNTSNSTRDCVGVLDFGEKTFRAIWVKYQVKPLGGGKVKICAEYAPKKAVYHVVVQCSLKKDMSNPKRFNFSSKKKELIVKGLEKGKRYYFQLAGVYYPEHYLYDYADWKFKQSVVVK